MVSDYKPLIVNTDPQFPEIEIYFAHDIHAGSESHDRKKWERFKQEILDQPNRFIIWAGDYCENAVVGSKSDIYAQNIPPAEQKEWFTEQLISLSSRTICIVPGNHEGNRITRTCGLFPAYDCALMAGIAEKYRQHFAFVDIGVGKSRHGKGAQNRYVGYVTHRLRDCKTYNGSDFVDGIDFACYGHDHDPKDHARSKLVYDSKTKTISQKDVEVIDSGSFMSIYGGYGSDAGYRPQSSKLYKIVLSGGRDKGIKTVGYHI